MTKLIGHTINNFKVQDVLGQGGMGIVYRAYHPDLMSYAAVKVMRPEYANQPGFYERFLQEARTAARLTHPGIVDVINFGRYQDSYYLMMDYIEGPNLRTLINEHPKGMPLWDVFQVFLQIAEVLEFSLAAGVLHRDLKPDNILLTKSVRLDQPYRAIVTDFGLVKLAENSIFQTQEGVSVGTPAYMSPEQCRGGDLDGRSDLYSLGVMLYECVCGSRPYPIRNLFDAAKFHASGKLVPLRAHRAETPAQLDLLVRRMLAPELDRRPANAAEIVASLKKIITAFESGAAEPASGIMSGIYEKLLGGPGSRPQVAPTPAAGEDTPRETLAEQYYVQVAYQGQWEERRFPLADTVLQVGRQPASGIVLDKPERFVSKQHCEILLRDGRVLIRDLGSTNGTFLGDNRLSGDAFYEWDPAVNVILGPFTLALKKEAAQAPPPPPPVAERRVPFATTKVRMSAIPMLICPGATPERLPLGDKPVVIGRAPGNDMVAIHNHVSKQHCRIQRQRDGQITVTDLHSTNGTYLGESRLAADSPTPWTGSPPLRIGPFSFTLEPTSKGN